MISPPPSLKQTQQLLWKLITAAEGVDAGRARLDPAERVVADELVVGTPSLSAVECLDIYANMYFFRIRDALQEDFPAVAAVIGARNFHNLITDYLVAHPPSHYSLRHAGAQLPSFLRLHALVKRWPYIADLAVVEWALLDAFDAADAPVLEATTLAAVPPARWPDLRFQLAPSVRVFELGWPVHEILKAVQARELPEEPVPESTVLRVWRQGFCVYFRPIEAAEQAALRAIERNATFAETCESVELHGGDAERTSAMLNAWLSDGVLSGFSAAPSPPPDPGARSGGG